MGNYKKYSFEAVNTFTGTVMCACVVTDALVDISGLLKEGMEDAAK